MPTCLVASPDNAAAPAAIRLQFVVIVFPQAGWHRQLVAQRLQLLVEIGAAAVLEEAKHQQVCDVLLLKACTVADLRRKGESGRPAGTGTRARAPPVAELAEWLWVQGGLK